MKENFLTSMFMEGGKISHKRVISVSVAVVLCWAIVFAMWEVTPLTSTAATAPAAATADNRRDTDPHSTAAAAAIL